MSWFAQGVPPQSRGGQVAIGNFDGVHRGHQAMVARLVDLARKATRPAVVVTFDPHPLALLSATGAPPPLTTIEHRRELLLGLGVDQVLVLETSSKLLALTAEEFFTRVIRAELGAQGLVEGPNFYFGKDRGGNITLLRQLCQSAGLTLDVIEPVTWQGQWVSSSAIRSLLTAGELTAAVELLGHPYRVTGQVVTGAQRGRTLGFPTANLADVATTLPGHGVYAGRVRWDGRTYAAAVNVGPNPTFGEGATKLEVHLIDFVGDLYGQRLDVDLTTKLRGVRKFDSAAALRAQLAADIAAATRDVAS